MNKRSTNQSWFSVIIPLYNKEKSIRSTIESVLNQTYPGFELIVVNDGSTDNSISVVKQFNDERIKLFDKANGGVSSARNYGVEKSSYELIAFLDADDLWLPQALEEFSFLINQFPEAELYATGFSIDEKNIPHADRRFLVDNYHYHSVLSYIKKGSPLMITGCVAMKKNRFLAVGGYNERFSRGEDLDLWKRLTDRYTLAKSEVVTMIYRQDIENRVSFKDEADKTKLYNQYPEHKNKVTNKYEKVLYGLMALGDIRYYLTHLRGLNELFKLTYYFDWIIQALIFYIKIKYTKK